MTILIAGGSGYVGKNLNSLFTKQGYEVIVLSRSTNSTNANTSHWSPDKEEIDLEAFLKSDVLINLSGHNINTSWNKKNKELIINSRTKPQAFLAKLCQTHHKTFKQIICASAIGYYPQSSRSEEIYDENSAPGSGFLSNVVQQWEMANSILKDVCETFTQTRIGVVLGKNGGAFPLLHKSTSFIGSNAIGTGHQGFPWIHEQDVCNGIIHLINKNQAGTFNFVAPAKDTQKSFSKQLSRKLNMPFWPLAIPNFLINVFLGKRSKLITQGCYASSSKLINSGYQFNYPTLETALQTLC